MRIGIDLGGTKIELLAMDDAGTEVLRFREPTPQGDYDATVARIVAMVARAATDIGADFRIGVGTPGAISPATGRIKNANSTCLNGRPLREDLRKALARPLRMANDADCLALSEVVDGAAAGATSVFAVIIGTGTGAGIVINGRPLSGPNAIAGEWGHNPLPWPRGDELPGRDCYCGRSGCIETWLSGPGFEADHYLSSGQSRTSEDIVLAATEGDKACADSLARYCARMARGLASIINVLDPEVIVLGGGLSNIDALYTQVPALWGDYVFSDRVDTQLVRAAHGDSSGVRGAAFLWSPEDSD